jgi:hypothetical protein
MAFSKNGFLLVIVLAILFLKGAKAQDTTYRFEHFSLSVPKQFSIDTSGLLNTVCILSTPAVPNDAFVENIMITRQTGFYRELTLEAYKERAENVIKQFKDVTLLTSELVTLKNQPTYHLVYQYKSSTGDQKIECFAFKNTYLIYLLTYTADPSDFEKWRPAVLNIAEQFTWYN